MHGSTAYLLTRFQSFGSRDSPTSKASWDHIYRDSRQMQQPKRPRLGPILPALESSLTDTPNIKYKTDTRAPRVDHGSPESYLPSNFIINAHTPREFGP